MDRHVEVEAPLHASVDEALAVLRSSACEVVAGVPFRGGRRGEVAIPVGIGDTASLSRRVALTLGTPSRHGDTAWVHVTWEPVGDGLPAPAFDGAIEVVPASSAGSVLRLVGDYVVPLGALGRVVDATLGRRVAAASLAELVGAISERLDAAVIQHRRGVPHGPTPYNRDLRPRR